MGKRKKPCKRGSRWSKSAKKCKKTSKSQKKSDALRSLKGWVRKMEACALEKKEIRRAAALANPGFRAQSAKMQQAAVNWRAHKAATGERGRAAHRAFMSIALK